MSPRATGSDDRDELEARLQAIVDAGRYMTLATADRGGTPWASPVWYAHRDYREFVWVSKPEARHSVNLEARPQLAIVIFDSRVKVGEAEAVYLEATARRVEGPGVESAISVFSGRSEEQGIGPWAEADVSGQARLRLYRATVSGRYLLGEGDLRIPVPLAR